MTLAIVSKTGMERGSNDKRGGKGKGSLSLPQK
ncbi:hypothetical protein CEB3_c31070 [Peptococcaceae bacterium CEB3]|nr:hypothetical protein CEB3_c31070 [Peptococcaceae bacterium CEB3]